MTARTILPILSVAEGLLIAPLDADAKRAAKAARIGCQAGARLLACSHRRRRPISQNVGPQQTMHVVPLTASNVAEYRSLMLHAYEQAADAFTSTADERAAEPDSWWVGRVAGPDGTSVALGAFHEGRLVGTVAIEFSTKPKTRHKALVIGMFVLETHRGLGVGKALVQAVIDCAKSRIGVLLMTLTVTQGNDPAINLYKASGFKEFGIEPMAILTPSGYKAKVHMWLGLADANALD